MLKADNVTMTYQTGVKALVDVSLEVKPNQIYCLLGTNGAGKSTLMYLFLDFIRPSSGVTAVDEIVVQEDPIRAKSRVAYLPDDLQLFAEMRAIDNLSFFAKLSGRHLESSDLYELFDRVRLDRKWAGDRVGHFSKGMRQKLALAILLVRNTSNFLLDEPTGGLDAQTSRDLVHILTDLRSSGACILMATHDLLRAEQLADVVGILHLGHLREEIPGSQLGSGNLESMYVKCLEDE
jgi:ABC-2 type transport system ATP-binding protein